MEIKSVILGAAIKKARKEKAITQEQLAERVNITAMHVKQLESGKRKPSIDVLFMIANELNLSIDDIFFPTRTETQKMIQKISCNLNKCSLHELYIVHKMLEAMLTDIYKLGLVNTQNTNDSI